ncbi:MAG: hypothetical protein ACKVPX_05670 [Myxococcaceae bacterium]
MLAAIAIPNFIRFQARAKQSEAKGNLKAIFTGERAYYQEKDRYSASFTAIGFAPERGNRYGYALGATATSPQVRTAVDITGTAGDTNRIEVDTFKYAGATAQPVATGAASVTWATDPGDPGAIPGEDFTNCPATTCAWSADATGNIDSDSIVDNWFVASTDGVYDPTSGCGRDPTDTAAPAGEPQLHENDVSC